MDLLIKGGQVVDGTGAAPIRADVAVIDGRISEIGQIDTPPETDCLDATGLLVGPGLIDIHSHSDYTLLVDPRAISSIYQGVTLEVIGNCGHGCAPIGDPDLSRSNIYGCQKADVIDWRTMEQYFQRLEANPPAVNVLSLVPNGLLRLAVCQQVDRPSTSKELRRMKTLLSECLDQGAFGFSTGLEYGPEVACPEQEIVELCKVVAESGGLYATHTRNRYGKANETIAEAIRTATAAKVGLQISHIQVVARLAKDGAAAMAGALSQVDRARQEGLDIGFDMHTRLFGTTNLRTALPSWMLRGDTDAIAARLSDLKIRRELKRQPNFLRSLAQDNWTKIVVIQCNAHPEFSRKTIAEIAELRGTDPMDAIYDMLLDEVDNIHHLMIMAMMYHAEENRIAFDDPACMVGSDATALAPDGPLAERTFHGAYTWASWFFSHFVRKTNALKPEEALRRLTSLPASRLGLTDRGILRQGACADLAIFDPALFSERGTTYEPNQTAVGMVHVVVNGVVTMKDGHLTGRRGGKVIRNS